MPTASRPHEAPAAAGPLVNPISGERGPEPREPITVRRYGSAGPSVVVLHGGPGAPGSVADLAAALGTWFVVHEPLQRWSGIGRLTVARHVDDLVEVFPPGAMIVGSSWGAMLALSFAARHPSLPHAIALVGTGTYDAESRTVYAAEVAHRLGRRGRLTMHRLGQRLRQARSRDERDQAFAEIGRLVANAQGVGRIPSVEPGLPVDGRGYEETWSDVLRLQRNGVEPQSFAAIQAPVVMLHGDRDPHPGPLIRERLREVLPQLEYVELAGCGHEPWREAGARETFLALLRDWLEAHAVRP